MNLGDLLTPWLVLAVVILPLAFVEKWIHSHLYGVGWLLTNNEKSATALYYVLLSPGVFIHEFTQYIVAGALNVKIKRVIAWPDAQKDGTLRLDFVRIQKANRAQIAVLGTAPLIVGLALVWLISSQMLNLDRVVEAIPTGDLNQIASALQEAASAPDFLLWMYIIFTISNAMLPTPAERQAWPLLFGLFAVVISFLVLIGVGDVLMETFTGPVARGVEKLTIAFATVLIAEIPGILTIGFFEEVLEKITKRKFQYGGPQPGRARRSGREPGSSLPLPPGAPFPSIYNLHLPIPTAAEVKAAPVRPKRPTPVPERSTGLAPRPAFEAADTGSAARPGQEPRPVERERVPQPSPPADSFARRGVSPADEPSPTARSETPFTRRSPLTEGDSPAREERPPLRESDSGSPSTARPASPFSRQTAPPSEGSPPTDRFTRPQPGQPLRSSPLRDEDDEGPPLGTARRPSSLGSSPFTNRPSLLADDDEDEITYEDLDDADSALDDDDYADIDGVDDE